MLLSFGGRIIFSILALAAEIVSQLFSLTYDSEEVLVNTTKLLQEERARVRTPSWSITDCNVSTF